MKDASTKTAKVSCDKQPKLHVYATMVQKKVLGFPLWLPTVRIPFKACFSVFVFCYLSYLGYRFVILRGRIQILCGGRTCHQTFFILRMWMCCTYKIPSLLFSVEFKGHRRSPVVKLRKSCKLRNLIIGCQFGSRMVKTLYTW